MWDEKRRVRSKIKEVEYKECGDDKLKKNGIRPLEVID